MPKKSFAEDLNPALQFISTTEAITEKDGERTRFVFATPERETFSRRYPLLMKPSVFEGIKAKADKHGASMNAYINALLEYHLKEGD